jgi:biopolymer transport protein ExbD
LINEQKKQIDGLSQELNKAYTHIDSLYLLQGGEQMVPKRKNFIEISIVSKNSYSENCKLLNKTSDSSKFKAFNEVDEEAIREALTSQGDKSMLIEKLISVLKLAREVQSVNVQLR